MPPIPMDQWRWDGHAGHFIGVTDCNFRLHTRIGDYRISTVGDWWPKGWEGDQPKEIGSRRTHETFVFRVSGPDEGEVSDWSEIETDGYTDCEAARLGHMAMCAKYAAVAGEEITA